MDVQWIFRILEKWCCSLNSGSARVTEVPQAVCEGAGGGCRLVNSHLKQPPLQQKRKQYLILITTYESFSDVPESLVWLRANFQSGSRVLEKVF